MHSLEGVIFTTTLLKNGANTAPAFSNISMVLCHLRRKKMAKNAVIDVHLIQCKAAYKKVRQMQFYQRMWNKSNMHAACPAKFD